MKLVTKINNYFAVLLILGLVFTANKTQAQYNNKWMTAGAFQDWYSEIGNEIEVGFVDQQQYGGEWPAIHPNQDSKAARGLWIGCTNFTDASGANFPYKVVHVGPRVNGAGEFFPVEFKLISQFNFPQVFVDGSPSFNHPTEIDQIDPTIKSDLELITIDNTQIGLTMTRKIYQFSQQDNDNYMIYDFTFTNTGNTGSGAQLNQTLNGVYFYWQYRNASNAETRNEIGNATGWGINTMNDARGDGAQNEALYNDPPNQKFRAQFSYHGHYPPFTKYDNLGGPLWTSAVDVPVGDTVGRLSAIQFYGVVTIHADSSPTDTTDDINQPSTTNYISSDATFESNNDSFNPAKMQTEYSTVMSTGHESPRHADKVQPDGKFDQPTGDPSLGTTGGYSFGNGYGPYTIAPGQSVHIVMAEGIGGLSRAAATRIGIAYKNGTISAQTKNDSVLTGQDSLFQTFRRAISNYDSGFNIPEAPQPPQTFNVNSGGDKISLSWDIAAVDPNIDHFNLYRETGQYDSTAHLITAIPYTGATSYNFDDVTPVRGLSYFYYVTAVGKNGLHSSRYYTQSFDPATLKRPAGTSLSQIRVVPNPFNISADQSLGFGAQQPNRLYFFDIPGKCTIKIYTEIGELIYTIHHTDGSGDAYWDSVTSSQQIVVSGVYIAVVHDDVTGEQRIVKFVIIR
ncbi:MAG TPA: hypothetical protein VJ954_02630 [Ignavibacteriaceae bacterium]|nr:hypothetical protein [Ignavibacteriaceae bacterium]